VAHSERRSTKFQAPNNKQIQMTKIQNSKQNLFGDLKLGIGVYLGFEIWNFRRYALSALRSALFGKVVFPDLFDPADHVPEFIQKGHLVEVMIQRGSR
jgi:hypothetical protein